MSGPFCWLPTLGIIVFCVYIFRTPFLETPPSLGCVHPGARPPHLSCFRGSVVKGCELEFRTLVLRASLFLEVTIGQNVGSLKCSCRDLDLVLWAFADTFPQMAFAKPTVLDPPSTLNTDHILFFKGYKEDLTVFPPNKQGTSRAY